MDLTKPEKLMLAMLADIHNGLQKAGLLENPEIDADFVQAALFGNHGWALDWQFSALLEDDGPRTREEIDFVVAVLNMWRRIEQDFELLDADGKAEVRAGVRFGGEDPRFDGFDGNDEGALFSITSFFVEDMGRWEEFRGRPLNSHAERAGRYRRMLQAFRPIYDQLEMHGRHMTAAELASVLNAPWE